MNRQELSEIRRRLNPEKNNIDYIRGCYVNEKHEIVSEFAAPLSSLPQEDAEKYLSLFKRTLSGIQEKNLVSIDFRADQVMEGEQHRLLSSLVSTSLKVDQAVDEFYRMIIDSLILEGSYLILLMHDTYDVPFHRVDGNDPDGDSENVFSYMICSICPVHLTKPALCYCAEDRFFHDREGAWTVTAPELGFMFPSYDDRATNLYSAIYYMRDASENHNEFVKAVFDNQPPMAAVEQKATFDSLICDALEDDCSLDVIQAMHEKIGEKIEEHKNDKTAPAPTVSKREVSHILASCGVPEDRVTAFEEKFDEEFGVATDLHAQNIINNRQFELKTPDVVVKVNPERSDLIETRVIDGQRYILIRAEDGVEVNGINISISAEELGEDVAPF